MIERKLLELLKDAAATAILAVTKERRIGSDSIDHSAALANLATALENAARVRLMALGGYSTMEEIERWDGNLDKT